MNKDVLLSIQGLHYASVDDEAAPIEVITPAEYYFRNGKHYILYNEMTNDHTAKTNIKVKIADDYVEIKQKGATTANLLFEKGKKHFTSYSTPFGNLLLSVSTNSILFEQHADEMTLEIIYLLEANNQPIADCHLKLHVMEKNSSLFSLGH